MERLTHKRKFKQGRMSKGDWEATSAEGAQVIYAMTEMLAAYEDTDLTPAEITALQADHQRLYEANLSFQQTIFKLTQAISDQETELTALRTAHDNTRADLMSYTTGKTWAPRVMAVAEKLTLHLRKARTQRDAAKAETAALRKLLDHGMYIVAVDLGTPGCDCTGYVVRCSRCGMVIESGAMLSGHEHKINIKGCSACAASAMYVASRCPGCPNPATGAIAAYAARVSSDKDDLESIKTKLDEAIKTIECMLWLAIDADGNSLCQHACAYSDEQGNCTAKYLCTPKWRGVFSLNTGREVTDDGTTKP